MCHIVSDSIGNERYAMYEDTLPYVLNGPIYLFLLGILLVGLEVNILHENNMLQDLLQICKFHWRHNYVSLSELVYPSDLLVLL